jgi:hypothetical protein
MPSESTGAGQGCALKSSPLYNCIYYLQDRKYVVDSLQKKNLKIETNYDLKKKIVRIV